MTEEKKKKVLSLGARPKLELKKPVVPSGGAAETVRQSFSHGRSKAVVVEAKKPIKRGESDAVRSSGPSRAGSVSRSGRTTGAVLHSLTAEEREARARALRGAAAETPRSEPEYFQAEAVRQPEPEPSAEPIGRDALRQRELEEMRRIQEQEKAESVRKKQEDEVRQREIQNARRTTTTTTTTTEDRGRSAVARPGESLSGRPSRTAGREEEEEDARRKPGKNGPSTRRGVGTDRRSGHKVNVSQALSDEEGSGRRRSVASMRRRAERHRREAMEQQQRAEPVKVTRDVTIPEAITVQELANRMAERGVDVIKVLMKLGVMATITQTIDADTAELVATEFGHRVKRVTESDIEAGIQGAEDKPEELKPRAPVVTVMGHVDHGKT
ncbi:MAG: translation initiation factor IF-2 N-terminal domain-containing protein, partial [Alphaproteobacteria bacterium]|nr:translation initiation factor IF-2 N-terminal domain-containing protein [Alphaproteobacteria bacterium]